MPGPYPHFSSSSSDFPKFRNIAPYLHILRPQDQHRLLGQISMLLWFNSLEMLLQQGADLHHFGRLSEARQAYEAILERLPEHPQALHLHGTVLSQNGSYDQALESLKRALRLLPDSPGVMTNLALTLKKVGRIREAAKYFERALALNPQFAPARGGLQQLCLTQGDQAYDNHCRAEALAWYRRSLKHHPDDPLCLNNCAIISQEMGRIPEAQSLFLRAMNASANAPFIHSNYLLGMHYQPGMTQQQYYMAAKAFGAEHQPDASFSVKERTSRRKRLRLGYISGDFSGHAVSTFILPLLEVHDPRQVQTVLFSNAPIQPRISRWLDNAGIAHREIHQLDDDRALQALRAADLDLLVDLSGHTAKNRLPVLARRAAPVQATWLGYFNTTGIASMDYLIADEHCCPPGRDVWYTEKIIRLPASFFCYSPSRSLPLKATPPCTENRPFTFGCFNETHKLNEHLISAWAEILRRTSARLYLKAKGFADKSIVRRYRELFAAHGAPAEQLLMEQASPREKYMAAFNKVDLLLDPFPYNGGTVTCDALWMGVPVLTLAGEMIVGRMGCSLLHAAGGGGWVCATREEYIQRAVFLADHPERIAPVRKEIRPRMLASPLCDRQGFVKNLMHAYSLMTGRA